MQLYIYKKKKLTKQPYGVIEVPRSCNRPLGDAKEKEMRVLDVRTVCNFINGMKIVWVGYSTDIDFESLGHMTQKLLS